MNRHKYNARKTPYDGDIYDSKLEAGHAAELDLMLKAGEILSIQRQYTVMIDLYDANGIHRHTEKWKCDFRVEECKGKFALVESKGFEESNWRKKKQLVEKFFLPTHPNYRLVVLKKGQVFTPSKILPHRGIAA